MKRIIQIIDIIILILILSYFGVTNYRTARKNEEERLRLEAELLEKQRLEEEEEKKKKVVEFEINPVQLMDPSTPEYKAMEKGLPAPPKINIHSWEYLLVNADNPLDESYAPSIQAAHSSSSSSLQDERIVEALNRFTADAEAQGLSVYLSSGYRSYWDQDYLFEMKCEQYDYETAAMIVAVPGTSEHQTGLSCDITDHYREFKNSDLEYTDTYQWMSAHCAEYGFIVRFPNNKSEITGIIYEPWHFRYVGVEAATYIMENQLTLEEFWELYNEMA